MCRDGELLVSPISLRAREFYLLQLLAAVILTASPTSPRARESVVQRLFLLQVNWVEKYMVTYYYTSVYLCSGCHVCRWSDRRIGLNSTIRFFKALSLDQAFLDAVLDNSVAARSIALALLLTADSRQPSRQRRTATPRSLPQRESALHAAVLRAA